MLYILLGSKDEEVFFGLSLGPIDEPVPALILILLAPLLCVVKNEDDEHLLGTIACWGSLLLLLVFIDKEVIRLRSFVLMVVLLS